MGAHEENIHTIHMHHAHNEAGNTPDANEPEPRPPIDEKKSLLIILGMIMVIAGIIVGIILIGKYAGNSNKGIVEYNNYVFQKFEGNKWMTQQLIKDQLYNIPFYNNPTQVLDIPVDPASIQAIRDFSMNPNGTVYITVDPYESSKVVLAGVEYARILGTSYDIYDMNVKSAISGEGNITIDSPVITCQDQSKDTLVIYQVVTDKNLVSVNRNCIVLESKNATESIRVADAFAFRLLDIIVE